MFKTLKFLFKKIREYNFMMLPIMLCYTILSTVYPFIWVLVPAKIIGLAGSGNLDLMFSYILLGAILAIISVMGTSYLRGNYRMRMNIVRYEFIRDLIGYSLNMPYENTLSIDELTKIQMADRSIGSPVMGAGGIILILLSFFGNLLASLGFLGILFQLSPWIMVLIVALVGISFYLNSQATEYDGKFWYKKNKIDRKFDSLGEIMMDTSYISDIKIYGLKNLIDSYMTRFMGDLKALNKNVVNKYIRMESGVALINIARDLGIFGYISLLLFRGQIDTSQFYLYTTGTISLSLILEEAFRQLSEMKREAKRFDSFIELMEDSNLKEDKETAKGLENKENIEKVRGFKVDIVDLTFKYPNANEPVIDGMNLTIKSGEKMALVGENGSGKSTLIKLLCKLYRPTSGKIYINGRDIEEIPDEDYWKLLGVVFQDAMVFPFSIRENISLSESLEQEDFQRALKNSGMKEVVDSLERREETTLLRILEDDGLDISGGQRQKLYLARAIYKESSFLILDEPTAALDPLAEAELYEKYNSLSENKTSLYISHRLASTKFCDRIAYLKDGKIIELGSHKELIEKDGNYRKLFDIQAKYYRENEKIGGGVYEI